MSRTIKKKSHSNFLKKKKLLKKISRKIVRRSGLVLNGSASHKLFDYKWNLD